MVVDAHEQSTAYLRALLRDAISLLEVHGRWRRSCRIGPLSFVAVSNSEELEAGLTRCLPPGGDGHDLTIGIISGSRPPFAHPPAWNLPHTDNRHLERLHLSRDGSFAALFNPDFGQWFILDRKSRYGLLWIGDEALLPSWEQGSPFKTVINWFTSGSPLFMVHAGAVGAGSRGCLLVGQGGSGKSTTVAACFARGMGVCGDDLILVEELDQAYRAWGLYDSLKLDPESAIAIPAAFASAPSVMAASKRLVRYSDVRREGFMRHMPLTAIVRCVITGGPETRIVGESPAAMLKSLAPPTVFLLRGFEEVALRKIGRIVRRLPCFRLELGADPAEAAARLEDWLESPAEAAAGGAISL